MAGEFSSMLRRRVLGVAMLALIVALVALSVAIYDQKFTKVVLVKLETDHTGNQLLPHSDVKERGVVVGEVRSISSHGDGATITLALNPGQAPGPVVGGQTICQDNSAQYAEIQNVLADLMPVLLALKPAELNATLNALATALNGRGEQIGRDLVKADAYLRQLNPHVPQLVDDLDKLGKVALEYNDAAPDLIDTLTNLQTTSKTLVAKRAALDSLLKVATSTSDVLTNFLDTNASRLITVTSTSNVMFTLLAEYAPEYGCLLKGLADLDPRIEEAFRGG